MAAYRKSPEAEADLLSIWRYVAGNSRARATRFIDTLHGTMGMLEEVPGAGRLREDLAPRLRGFPAGGYTIFYREVEGGIEVARVLNARQDMRHLFSER